MMDGEPVDHAGCVQGQVQRRRTHGMQRHLHRQAGQVRCCA